MKIMKREKGITLVALIITIIILIILAGVTLTLGIDIIMGKSKSGVDAYKESSKNENTNLDEVFASIRAAQGTGREVYNITDEKMPSFIKESNLETILSQDVDTSKQDINFINYDKANTDDGTIQDGIYYPTKYKIIPSNESIKIELKDEYILYIYACANSNDSNKGTIKVRDLQDNSEKTSYILPARDDQNVEPLQIVLKTGNYEITTSYNSTMLFKIQLEPIMISNNTTNGNENNDEDNSVITWDAPTGSGYTLPTWLSIITNSGTRAEETPFTDTSIKNAIKIKDGFSIDLGEKTYNIEIYITGGSSVRTLTLNEDNTFSQTLEKRSVTGQSSITLNNKTGTLNFKVSGESQLYKIVLTEVK